MAARGGRVWRGGSGAARRGRVMRERDGRDAGEIFSLYKKYEPQNGPGVYSLYKSMTHKMGQEYILCIEV